MAKSFVSLHTHSEYSILDGHAKIKPMAERAAELGMPALAVTDHGAMYGLLDHYKTCHEVGIKPILGMEAYTSRHSISERPSRKKKSRQLDDSGQDEKGNKLFYHLTVLAENNAGYQNLMKLSSRSFTEGFFYKPRIDFDILSDHSEGLIVTSGCLGGIILQELLQDNYDAALEVAGRYQDIFGDGFFIELMDHGLPEQARTNPELIRISKQLNVPIICTQDSHYINQSDSHSHDCLLCVQTVSKISDTDRFRFSGDDYYMKSPAEMRDIFRDHPEACDNTLVIAERCNVEIEFGRNLVPKFEVPDGFVDEEDYLRSLVFEGAQTRWDLTEEVTSRIEFELDTIVSMGFAGYFLIVWDLVRHAQSVGIRVGPGRGSAGGSCVSYSLGITEIDPLRWGLLFERFLNPGRGTLEDEFQHDLKLICLEVDNNCRSVTYNGKSYSENLGFI